MKGTAWQMAAISKEITNWKPMNMAYAHARLTEDLSDKKGWRF
jgi:hypothetical protein